MKKFKKFVKKLKIAIRMIPFLAINRSIMLLVKVKKNQILFASDVREEMGGNLKYVYDYLPDTFRKVTDFKRDRRDRRGLTQYLKLAYYMTTSAYIVLEDFFDYTAFIKVRKGQEICQLWHGAGAYKKFAHSRTTNNREKIKIHAGYKKYTKVIVSAEPIRSCYAEAFHISMDKVQATGIPRTDCFFDKNYITNVRITLQEQYPQLKGKKVILFAPTYRGTLANDAAYDFDKLNLDELYPYLKDNYIFVFKWHPAAYNNIKLNGKEAYRLGKYDDCFLDLSDCRDINDLLLIADILVTDYSSVIFDWLLVEKPIIYYAYDMEDYAGTRGLYFNFEEYVYGSVAKDQEQLIQAIYNEDMQWEKRAAFRDKFMSACDGTSTEKTCKWIFHD